jgi:hypothetical protein
VFGDERIVDEPNASALLGEVARGSLRTCPTLAEDPRLPRQLYVFQLLPSVDVECLSAIFERDTVESLAVYDDARKTDG